MVLQLKTLDKDVRIPIPEYTIGDRVRYISDETLREWAKEESSPATVVGVKLRMFRQGPDSWGIVYFIVFDTPWPVIERTLSGAPIRELSVYGNSLELWRE
ncbi:hypothetical protein LCGC14_1404660 [marine sediment metagenome]|uniref:Uncharacterized protein n=1 Tax=marine sediment metagenome TaxID=412755 RepID=A0A0F9KH03_9ZZZZ